MKRLLLFALLAACGKDLSQLQPFACARDKTCPASYICIDQQLCEPWEACELVASRGTCPAASPRCTVLPAPNGGYGTACVFDSNSNLREGEVCNTSGDATYALTDGCPAGTLCYDESSAGGATEPANHCRAFCAGDADCAGGGRCALAFTGAGFAAVATRGVCESPCDPFGTCTEPSHHCEVMPSFAGAGGVLTCRANGTVDAGGDCSAQNCKPGLFCIPALGGLQATPTCRVTCDAAHSCAAGSCDTTALPMAGGAGFCH